MTGSLTGEALNEELLMEMSKKRDLGRKSAYDRIKNALKSYKKMHRKESRGKILLSTC